MAKKKVSKLKSIKGSFLGLLFVLLAVNVVGGFLLYDYGYSKGYESYDNQLINAGDSTYYKGFQPNNTEIEKLVNDYRTIRGLSALVHDERLCSSAKSKSEDMSLKKYFSHNGPDGSEPWDFIDQYLGNYYNAGENLAISNKTDKNVVDGWIASPSHERNMVGDYNLTCVQSSPINKFTLNGVSYTKTSFVVQHFALKK